MIKLALSDLDDTLIPLGEPNVSLASREAISAVLNAGVHFGPVTGRLPVDMEWMFSGDEKCYATGAFANGQVIRIDGEVVKEVTISAHYLAHVQQVLEECGEGYLCIYGPWVAGQIAYITDSPHHLRKNPPPTYGSISQVLSCPADFPTDYRDEDGKPAFVKANIQTCCADVERPILMNRLRQEVPELSFVSPGKTAAVIDIVPKGWNKGCGVHALTEALGISDDEFVVFGDAENDLAMIDAAKHSVAVANAAPVVASHARWHIGACFDGAVDRALLDIAAAARQGRMPSFMEEALQ